MDTLYDIGVRCHCDKSEYGHQYLWYYEQHFGHLRGEAFRLLEIGVQNGHSIRMWLEFFPKAQVFGVDIDDCAVIEDARYRFVKGDQSHAGFWFEFISREGGNFCVIVDDGGHKNNGIITSFNSLWDHVVPGGFYCIEDLYCAYRPEYQVRGWPDQMTFIGELMRDINNRKRDIEFIHFSNELAIVKKQGRV